MLEFLDSPWVFGSITVASFALCFITWKAGIITFAKLGVVIGSKQKTNVSPHSKCPHSKDIMDLVHRTADHYEKIQTLKNSIIKEQMRFYEEIEEETNGKLKHIFTKLLLKKLKLDEPFIVHQDYVYFNLLMKVVFGDIKSYIRSCFTANHYITYTIEAQQDYVEKKKNVILNKATEMLNDCWRGSLIQRNEIYEAIKDNLDFFEKQLDTIFNRAFLITRDIYETIEQNEKEYTKYLNSVLGDTE